MKFAKLSILALAMGLFVASCGNNEAKTDGAPAQDSASTTTTTTAPVTTVDTTKPAVADTTKPATMDTAAKATTTTTKTEVKK